jgi:hypothetical protein
MTTALPRIPVVTPVVPTLARFRGSGAVARPRNVPVMPVVHSRHRAWSYAVAAVDDRGRIAARPLLQYLHCSPGTTVAIREQAGLLVVTSHLTCMMSAR